MKKPIILVFVFLLTGGITEHLFPQDSAPALLQTIQAHDDGISAVDLSPDGRSFLTVSSDKTAKVWDLATGALVQNFANHPDWVFTGAFSPDNKLVATGCFDGSIHIFSVESGEKITSWQAHRLPVYDVEFSPDGKSLVTASADKSIKIWRTRNWQLSETLRGHNDYVLDVAFSNEGVYLASASRDKTAKIWNLLTFSQAKTLRGHEEEVSAVAFTPDGKFLCTGSHDRTMKLWETQSGTLIRTFEGHTGFVRAIAVSNSGTLLATGSWDQTARIWERYGGTEVATYTRHTEDVNDVVFSRDGSKLVSVSDDLSIKIWNVPNPIEVIRNWETRRIEQLRDQKKSELATLFAPKGEFETSAAYEQRIAREKEKEQQTQEDFEQRIQDVHREAEQRIKEELTASRVPVQLETQTISEYDADTELFSIDVVDREYDLKVPRNSARDFKNNYQDMIIVGEKRRTKEGGWVYLNLAVTNAETGTQYPFGEQVGETRISEEGKPPQLVANVNFREPSGNQYLDARETGAFVITVENTGDGAARGVQISPTPSSIDQLDYGTAYIPEIRPGASESVTIPVQANLDVSGKEHLLRFQFSELNGFPPAPVEIQFPTREYQEPELHVVDYGIEDDDGNGMINPGEMVRVTLRIGNQGNGLAENLEARFYTGSENVSITDTYDKKQSLDSLDYGETVDATIEFYVNNRVNPEIPLFVDITESVGRANITEYRIPLKLDEMITQIQRKVIAGKEETRGDVDFGEELSIDVETDIPESLTENPNALAIIFGIERYRDVSPVTFASRDAAFIRKYFRTTLSIQESRIYFATNNDVTQGEFNKIFSPGGWLDKRVNPNESDIYVYYAGHGAPAVKEGEAYLIPYDGDPNYPQQTGYSLAKLYQNLGALQANSVTIFLDACFSGANRENKMLLADARPVFIEVEDPAKVEGVTVFSAASGKQISSGYPDKKHGLFTYFLLKGLQGAADTDTDKQLTLQELGDFVRLHVSETAGFLDREQTPELETGQPDKTLVKYE